MVDGLTSFNVIVPSLNSTPLALGTNIKVIASAGTSALADIPTIGSDMNIIINETYLNV
jgi:hypothetical protein